MTSPVASSSSPLSSSSSSRPPRAPPGIPQKTPLTFTLWAEESASPTRIHGRTAPHLMQRLFRQESDVTGFYTSLLQEHAPPPTYYLPLPKPGVSPPQPSHIPYPTPSPESIAAKHHAAHLATISRTPGFLSLTPVAGPPKAEPSTEELPRLAQLYQPHGKYAWTRGYIFEHVRAYKRFQSGKTRSVFINSASVKGAKLKYVSKNWKKSDQSRLKSFHLELALYKSRKYLRLLQGKCVPRVISLQGDANEYHLAMEPPHPVFWIEASSTMPLVLKAAVVTAFEKIHARGVLHGAPTFQRMLIGADCKVTIIGFQEGETAEDEEFVEMEEAHRMEMDMEMRKVKYMLDYPGARDGEKRKTKAYMKRKIRRRKRAKQGLRPRPEDMEDPYDPAVTMDTMRKEWKPVSSAPDGQNPYYPVRHVMPGVTPLQFEKAVVGFLAEVQRMEDDFEDYKSGTSCRHVPSYSVSSPSTLLPPSIKVRDFAMEGYPPSTSAGESHGAIKIRDFAMHPSKSTTALHPPRTPPATCPYRQQLKDGEDPTDAKWAEEWIMERYHKTLKLHEVQLPQTSYVYISTNMEPSVPSKWDRTAMPLRGILRPLRMDEFLAKDGSVQRRRHADDMVQRMLEPPSTPVKRKRGELKEGNEETEATERPKKRVRFAGFNNVSPNATTRRVRFASPPTSTAVLQNAIAGPSQSTSATYIRTRLLMLSQGRQPGRRHAGPTDYTRVDAEAKAAVTLSHTQRISISNPHSFGPATERKILEYRARGVGGNGIPSPFPTPPDSDPDDAPAYDSLANTVEGPAPSARMLPAAASLTCDRQRRQRRLPPPRSTRPEPEALPSSPMSDTSSDSTWSTTALDGSEPLQADSPSGSVRWLDFSDLDEEDEVERMLNMGQQDEDETMDQSL